MSRRKKPENISEVGNTNWIAAEKRQAKESASETLSKAKALEKEKLDSGLYHYVTFFPPNGGRPYQLLVKK